MLASKQIHKTIARRQDLIDEPSKIERNTICGVRLTIICIVKLLWQLILGLLRHVRTRNRIPVK